MKGDTPLESERREDLVLPIVYRRTLLRVIAAAFLLGALALNGSLIIDPPLNVTDQSTPSDWFVVLILPLMLAGYYSYVSAHLSVEESFVRIHNPFRQVDIPLAHVIEVIPGSNMAIRTEYAKFYAWGVEAANAQIAFGRFGQQVGLAEIIEKLSKTAHKTDAPPASYRWSRPDLFFLVSVSLAVVQAVLTGAGVTYGQ